VDHNGNEDRGDTVCASLFLSRRTHWAPRLSLSTYRRKLGPRPTSAQKLELAKRRERLQARLDLFEKRAGAAFGDLNLDEIEDSVDTQAPWITVGSDLEDHQPNADSHTPARLYQPESTPLLLPSTIGLERCKALNVENLAEMELRLREGQANDALHGLRIALSEKAVLFRAQVRHARSQVTKTRAWANVNAVDGTARDLSKVYTISRQAMIRLGASDTLLQRYRQLRREELNASTQLMDPSIPGQRNASLPWFWVMSGDRDNIGNAWMQECEGSSKPAYLCLTLPSL
jgi:hypothetical protein